MPAAAQQAARIDATGDKLTRGESSAALAAVNAEQAAMIPSSPQLAPMCSDEYVFRTMQLQ